MKGLKRFAILALACCLLAAVLPLRDSYALSGGEAPVPTPEDARMTYCNSDAEAWTDAKCYYVSEDSPGVFMMDPDCYPYETEYRTWLTKEPAGQIAFLDGMLYYSVTGSPALKRIDPKTLETELITVPAGEVERFAVTGTTLYYLARNTVFSVDLAGGTVRELIRCETLSRFWLADDNKLEYITDDEATVCVYDLRTGTVTHRENDISELPLDGVPETDGVCGLSVAALKAKFPHGKYWNHVGRSNNPDGYTSTPCTCHGRGHDLYGGCDCNSFSSSIQCYGFAMKLAYDYYGSKPWSWNIVYNLNTVKAGDYIRYKNDGHSIWVTAVNGDTITFVDCNYTGKCQIRWEGTLSKSTIRSSLSYVWSAPAALVINPIPAAPSVTVSAEHYTPGNPVNVSWAASADATAYAVDVSLDGSLLLTASVGAETGYSFVPQTAGSYSVTVTASNKYGSGVSAPAAFAIEAKAPEITLSIRNQSVTVAWEDVGAQAYDLTVEEADTAEVLYSGNADSGLQWELSAAVGSYRATVTAAYPGDCAACSQADFSLRAYRTEASPGRDGVFCVGEPVSFFVDTEDFTSCSYRILRTPAGGEEALWEEGTLEANSLDHSFSEAGAYSCALCVRTENGYTEAAPAAVTVVEHAYTQTVTPPSCRDRGYTTCTCAACGDSYRDAWTDPLGHDWDGGAVDRAPTETETGCMRYTCLRCGKEKTTVIPKQDETAPSLPCSGDSCPGRVFTDMPKKGNWAHDAIDWAVEYDITAGTSAATFSPAKGCTRAQVVTFLWRAAGSPEPAGTDCPFTDLKQTASYYKAVLWAVENGITAGTSETTFSPGKTCTRAQIVTFLWRFEDCPEPKAEESPFTDLKPDAAYSKAVVWAVENGITAGTSETTFSPGRTCTRAHVVTFLYRDQAAVH